MIILDTTVLAYAVGTEHPLRDPCREIVRAIQAGVVAATTTIEVIQEFAHVRARRHGRRDASILAHEYAGLLQPLIALDELDLKRGLELFEEHPQVGAFDALLASAATRRGVRALVSADSAFAGIPGLVALNPATELARIVPATP
jgi:predicted nucleic acid-binding protein